MKSGALKVDQQTGRRTNRHLAHTHTRQKELVAAVVSAERFRFHQSRNIGMISAAQKDIPLCMFVQIEFGIEEVV